MGQGSTEIFVRFEMDTATHKVLRPLPGPKGVIAAGTLVDARNWRNMIRLVETRFLAPLDAVETQSVGVSASPAGMQVGAQKKEKR